MSAVEAAAFESEPFADAALAVRGWDDAGKIDGDRVDGLEIPPVEHWEYLLVAPGLRR